MQRKLITTKNKNRNTVPISSTGPKIRKGFAESPTLRTTGRACFCRVHQLVLTASNMWCAYRENIVSSVIVKTHASEIIHTVKKIQMNTGTGTYLYNQCRIRLREFRKTEPTHTLLIRILDSPNTVCGSGN